MTVETAVLLAAGEGNRLKPITREIPKPLLEIDNIPMLLNIIKNLDKSGIKNFLIVINPIYESLFNEKLSDDYKIIYTYQENPSGMTDAILTTRSNIKGDFLVCAGDMPVPETHAKVMINSHDTYRPMATLSLFKANIEYVPGLGNVKMNASRKIEQIIEKPTKEDLLSNFYSLPFYIFTPELFKYLDKCPVSTRGERELQDAIQMAINDGKLINGVPMKKEFSSDKTIFTKEMASLHITNPTDYFHANMNELSGGITKPDDILCTIIEPVHIKGDCDVADDALLGPNVILGQNIKIGALAEISNAIIQDNVTISKQAYVEYAVIMEGANIGENQEIRGSPDNVKVIE